MLRLAPFIAPEFSPCCTTCVNSCASNRLPLPDPGTYWHLGKEVKKRISGRARPFEHPELKKRKGPAYVSKGDKSSASEKRRLRNKEARKMLDSGVRPDGRRLPKKLQ